MLYGRCLIPAPPMFNVFKHFISPNSLGNFSTCIQNRRSKSLKLSILQILFGITCKDLQSLKSSDFKRFNMQMLSGRCLISFIHKRSFSRLCKWYRSLGTSGILPIRVSSLKCCKPQMLVENDSRFVQAHRPKDISFSIFPLDEGRGSQYVQLN
ncbi:hypothetical protein HanIR_Chr09g0393801 [Helianthus annuus]|nr:hypothetical protein HanIR_Chr09g0393801 [Helianthus annuus]